MHCRKVYNSRGNISQKPIHDLVPSELYLLDFPAGSLQQVVSYRSHLSHLYTLEDAASVLT